MFEAVSEVASLTGRRFQHCRHPHCLFKSPVDGLGDQVEAFFLLNLVEMASGMEIEHSQSQLLTSPHLFEKRLPAHMQLLRIRASEIDQKIVVRKYLLRCKAATAAIFLEGIRFLRWNSLGCPAVAASGKKRETPRSYGYGLKRGVGHATLRTYMCSYIFHTSESFKSYNKFTDFFPHGNMNKRIFLYICIMNLSKTKLNLYCRLSSRKQREKLGLFIAEGEKCVADTIRFFTPEAVIVAEGNLQAYERYRDFPVYTVPESDMRKLSQFQSLPDVVAVYRLPSPQEFSNKEYSTGLTLMLDGVQDPGNLGTILRIASWFGVARVVIGPGCADPYNPKAVQSSMGAVGMVRFTQTDIIPIIESNPEIHVCGTLLDGTDIYTTPLRLPAFVAMGNEGNGLSDTVREKVDTPLLIPSFASGPHAESLNVAAATAITVSEFMRRTL